MKTDLDAINARCDAFFAAMYPPQDNMTHKYFEDYLEGIGAKWAHLGGGDYAVTLKTESV